MSTSAPYFYITVSNYTAVKKILFLLLFIPVLSISQIPEPEKGTYVNDQYGYLHPTQRLQINKQLRKIEDSTGVQVAIILIPAVPEQYSIEDYAREIGRKWHVGNAKNGLVYIAAIDQRKQRLEVASHLEGTVTDATASHLLAGVKPFFRAQKYAEGLTSMITQLQQVLETAKDEQRKLTADELKKKKAAGMPWWGWLLIWPICLGVPSYVIFRHLRKRREKKRQEELQARLKREAEIDRQVYANLKKQIDPENKYDKYGRPRQTQPATRNNIITDDPVLLVPPPEITEPIPMPIKSYSRDDDSGSSGGGYSSGSSGSDSGGSSGSSDYGSWGSGSSDSGSSSSDSGFSGGGSSDSW